MWASIESSVLQKNNKRYHWLRMERDYNRKQCDVQGLLWVSGSTYTRSGLWLFRQRCYLILLHVRYICKHICQILQSMSHIYHKNWTLLCCSFTPPQELLLPCLRCSLLLWFIHLFLFFSCCYLSFVLDTLCLLHTLQCNWQLLDISSVVSEL